EVSVGRGASADSRPVTIGLPRAYRGVDTGTAMPHVLDLPGVGADDPAEQAAVSRLVRHHVPLADLVVVVVSAEKMRTLVDMLSRAELDWLSWPGRFRIVLTHATYGYAAAFQDREDPVTVAELRAAVAEQLETFQIRRLVSDPGLRSR